MNIFIIFLFTFTHLGYHSNLGDAPVSTGEHQKQYFCFIPLCIAAAVYKTPYNISCITWKIISGRLKLMVLTLAKVANYS